MYHRCMHKMSSDEPSEITIFSVKIMLEAFDSHSRGQFSLSELHWNATKTASLS